jgi:putative hydrolase of the HAD superfamily
LVREFRSFCIGRREPQRLGIYAIWIDAHGEGLPAGTSIKPDRIIHSLTELLPVEAA